jgi:hypothetical protein
MSSPQRRFSDCRENTGFSRQWRAADGIFFKWVGKIADSENGGLLLLQELFFQEV